MKSVQCTTRHMKRNIDTHILFSKLPSFLFFFLHRTVQDNSDLDGEGTTRLTQIVLKILGTCRTLRLYHSESTVYCY